MARIVTADDLRARLGRELDALRETEEALYVSKRGRLSAGQLAHDRSARPPDRRRFPWRRAADPRPGGAESLAGRDDCRVRVVDYRTVYAVDDGERLVLVARIAHR